MINNGLVGLRGLERSAQLVKAGKPMNRRCKVQKGRVMTVRTLVSLLSRKVAPRYLRYVSTQVVPSAYMRVGPGAKVLSKASENQCNNTQQSYCSFTKTTTTKVNGGVVGDVDEF